MRTLKPFEYFEPGAVAEAVQILSTYGNRAKVLAGGIDLLPRMRQRLVQPQSVVSIQKIPGLDYIESKGAGLRFGALARLRSLELSPVVIKDYIPLYQAIHDIASVQVKTTGTAVGNLCVASPASDVATALFVLGAELTITSSGGERTIPIEDFFTGVCQTVLNKGEIVTAVSMPVPQVGSGSAFLHLTRTAADVAKVSVAVMIMVADNACKEAKIALGAVAPTIIRARKAEKTLKGKRLEPGIIAAAALAAAEEAKPITDIRSTAEYRKEMTRVIARRAIEQAIERAKKQNG